jgi:hypothetical protein
MRPTTPPYRAFRPRSEGYERVEVTYPLEDLWVAASKFRDAIDEAQRTDKLWSKNVPVNEYLGTFLCENGFGDFKYRYYPHIVTEGEKPTWHSWLWQNDLIVDIAADSLPGNNPKVIVCRADQSELHRSLECVQPEWGGYWAHVHACTSPWDIEMDYRRIVECIS